MRRSLLGLLTVVAIASLLVMAGCERTNVLRVVSINRGNSLRVDIADLLKYFDPVDSEYVTIYQHMPDSVEVVLQYVEIGAGLPTWTPYQVTINEATVTFTSKTPAGDDPLVYTKVIVPLDQTVVGDKTGKTKTTFYLTAIPSVWKQLNLLDYMTDIDPPEYDVVDLAKAQFDFSGYDPISDRDVKARGFLQVEFGNFYDDLSRFGK